jgi:hypothetical protein
MAPNRATAVRWDPVTAVQVTSETPIIFVNIPLSLAKSLSTLLATAAVVAAAGSTIPHARGSITVITTTATTYSGSTLVGKLARWFGANPRLG